MTTEISKKLQMLVAQEMGPMGAFIVKKQCTNLGMDHEELKVGDLPALSKALFDAFCIFTGEEKGKWLRDQIKKLGVEEEL
ncbi:MAG: hypothetical protein KAT70_01085 [Thermoplasmata archaeon]|nr:hypothetical protein [Thermoplasmata archaeon]